MRIVFIEASLELVPPLIANHPCIIRDSRKRGKRSEEILLEDYLHHSAIKKLKNPEKRGRADIIHRCLLLSLDSGVFKEIFIHTIEGKIIEVNPNVRIPRTYERFKGLMEKLLKEGVIETKNGETLLEVRDVKLEDVLKKRVVVFSERGEIKYSKKIIKNANTICLGAFPHGDFSDEVLDAFNRVKANFISIGNKSYSSLYVLCRAICLITL